MTPCVTSRSVMMLLKKKLAFSFGRIFLYYIKEKDEISENLYHKSRVS